MTAKPHAPATERNREPILAVLREHFADRRHVLEIGSGTGEHAVHFARALPQLTWQASDVAANLPGIRAWIEAAASPNLPPPIELDVMQDVWPSARYDALFSANTLHIMGWREVERMFDRLPGVADADAVLAIYGPFNYAGRFTSASNEAFDRDLRAAAPHRGLRDVEAVDALAARAGFVLLEDIAMPANNRCLVWRRGSAKGVGALNA